MNEKKNLNEKDTESFLSVSVSLLRKWRSRGAGPRPWHAGRTLRYEAAGLQVFVRAQQVEPPKEVVSV